ncbi:MAG: TonB-dependent receptor [Woeseia sp.]
MKPAAITRRACRRNPSIAYATLFAIGFTVSISLPVHLAAQEPETAAGLEVVVVTARKREENLQTTPISISAYSKKALEERGVTRIDEIAAYTPNLIYEPMPGFNGSTSAAAVYIRGVGQKEYLPTVEPGVGLYIDGVYIARSVGAVLDLIDVERIEVLRGPQGTLFGRNTIGGAISITSQKPADEFGGWADFTVGDDSRLDFKGSIDIPLSESLKSKVAIGSINREGYVQRADGPDLGDAETLVGKAAVAWTPVETLTFELSFDTTHADNDGAAFVLRDIDYRSALFNLSGLALAPPTFPLEPSASPSPFGGNPSGGGFAGTSPIFPGLPLYRITPPSLDPASPGGDVPVDNFALLNNYMATLLGGQDCLSALFGPFDPQGNPANPACYTKAYVQEDAKRTAGTFPSYSKDDIWGIGLNVEWDIGDLTLRSISAYREVDSTYSRDEDHSPLKIAQFNGFLVQDQLSQELQLLGTGFEERMNWIVGAYYLTESADSAEFVEFTPVSLITGGDVDNESYAAFAQATHDFTEQLSLTAGLRYTRDEKEFIPDQYITENRTGAPQFAPGTRILPMIAEKVDFSETTPMLSLAYQWTPDVMTYVTYSEGFKSGGFSQRVFPPLPEVPVFEPETVKVYEGGFKWDGFDHRLRLNAAVFHTDYEDLQVQVYNGIAPVIQNAASATIDGFEAEFSAVPAEGWTIEGGGSYVDAEYDELGANIIDISPNSEFENVPDWMLNLSIAKGFGLDTMGSLTTRLDWTYRGDTYLDTRNTEQLHQEGYHLVHGSLRFLTPDEKWSVLFGVRNIFDEDVILSGIFNSSIGTISVIPNRDREWLVSVQCNF